MGLWLRAQPFCVKSAGAAEGRGPLRPAIPGLVVSLSFSPVDAWTLIRCIFLYLQSPDPDQSCVAPAQPLIGAAALTLINVLVEILKDVFCCVYSHHR